MAYGSVGKPLSLIVLQILLREVEFQHYQKKAEKSVCNWQTIILEMPGQYVDNT